MATTSNRFGPFYLDARIAVGGTAEVYLARPVEADPTMPARVIVKRLLPHFARDPQGRTMFEREARLHQSIRHENVVKVFRAGVDDMGEPYLAMEYVDGVDGYRLLRRMRQDSMLLPVGVAVYIAREVLRALTSVHAAKDPEGVALTIVHRDISPSNIYLSKEGRVKLGDFGIARSLSRITLRSEQGQVIKGKFAYLAPEQVAGEPADHRADLFSLATVLAEMLLGKPLFPGSGQLAVLLAIRDCNIGALSEVRGKLPVGLFEVVERALSREPQKRFKDASEFAAALEPYAASDSVARADLAEHVRHVQKVTSTDSMLAVSAEEPRPGEPPRSDHPPDAIHDDDVDDEDEQKTGEYGLLPSFVETAQGVRHGPWTFARLMEALATGTIGRGDKVSYMGQPMKDLGDIEDLARFLPATTAGATTTNEVSGPGAPDFQDDLAGGHDERSTHMADVLVRVFLQRETGVLFAERARDDHGDAARKELYFVGGKLHHVASSNASELLGEYLVRRGKLARDELDLALAVLPRYGGRMGDTLISLGLVGPVDIFRAIREQGRDRVTDLFLWKQGKITFYRGQQAPHVEFPLDQDLPTLILAGLEAREPTDSPVERYRSELDRLLSPVPKDPHNEHIVWPPVVAQVLAAASKPLPLRDLLRGVVKPGQVAAGDVLRAIELLTAARLLVWQ
jgi:serine/threonine-protein kinase